MRIKFRSGNANEIDHLKDLVIDGMIIVNEVGVENWLHTAQNKDEWRARDEHDNWFYKPWVCCLIAEQLLAFQG